MSFVLNMLAACQVIAWSRRAVCGTLSALGCQESFLQFPRKLYSLGVLNEKAWKLQTSLRRQVWSRCLHWKNSFTELEHLASFLTEGPWLASDPEVRSRG